MRSTRIIRSRTGCFTCRRRKKKCNEEKPVCSGCKRNRLDCHWPAELFSPATAGVESSSQTSLSTTVTTPVTQPTTANTNTSPTTSPTTAIALITSADTPESDEIKSEEGDDDDESLQQQVNSEPPSESMEIDDHLRDISPTTPRPDLSKEPPSPIFSTKFTSNADPPSDDNMVGSPSPSGLPLSVVLASTLESERTGCEQSLFNLSNNPNMFSDLEGALKFGIHMPISLLPSHGQNSFELLSYYLARTANSMGNGSTDANPFIVKLIPLAFSNPLVLQLILAQSAAHRQASDEPHSNNEIAQRYYTDSLRMFRNVVDEYVSGKDDNMLILTVGSLILCLTEVARGDRQGTIFDHLNASKSLLTMLINGPQAHLAGDLPEFLVEYYMHMAASSMISTDAQNTSQSFFSLDIENLARSLVEKRYIGQLCGCWLELLLIIPRVFQLGQGILTSTEGKLAPPSASDIITFGFLQSQILAFFPDPSVTPYSRLAGLVFKQAVLLYLWSILGTPQQANGNLSHKELIHSAVLEAITLLNQFPASVRVNTSLCWPLTVIGCCTSDETIQQILRERLQTMVDTIGLGNMRETLTLLEHVWGERSEETSPWTLFKAMRKHQTWISFA